MREAKGGCLLSVTGWMGNSRVSHVAFDFVIQ